MLKKDEIITFLRENKKLLRDKYGVVDTGLIGSYARDEQTEESDIDFLVEFTEVKFSYLADLVIFLETKLLKKIDVIINDKYLRKNFLEIVEDEIIYA